MINQASESQPGTNGHILSQVKSEAVELGAGIRSVGYAASQPWKPTIGIYTGGGASHSWLWFTDLFDRWGYHRLVFLDEKSVRNGCLSRLDVFAVSGGDTFGVAEALGERGAEQIAHFLDTGGIYIGACAGAYLPMNSSKTPLNLFNFANVKITNLSKLLPPAKRLAHKYCTAYGCEYVFHPFREEVTLSMRDPHSDNEDFRLKAPLYGGPTMIAGKDAEVLAVYEDFTEKTLFLVDRETAADTALGKAAVVRAKRGNGYMYLFGPHFEHPRFSEANRYILDIIDAHFTSRDHDDADTAGRNSDLTDDSTMIMISGEAKKQLTVSLKREISNSRIVAGGLEFLPIRWLIGKKVYEPEKIRVFLEAMWSRIKSMEKAEYLTLAFERDSGELQRKAVRITGLLRAMKRALDDDHPTDNTAAELFGLLNRFTSDFFTMYFQSVALGVVQSARYKPNIGR